MNAMQFIPAADPLSNYTAYREEIDDAVQRVFRSGRYILGEEVAAFEAEFARYVGTDHCVGTANGTDALILAMRACGIGRGDAVFTVSHTAVATISAIVATGAVPVLVDIDPNSYTMNPHLLEEAIAGQAASAMYGLFARPRAVLPVHLYGHPADMPKILDVAAAHDLVVIEDCAQAHGAAIGSRRTGGWGTIAAFSFYPTKNLGALGDGGAVTTNRPDLAERVRLLRQYGWQTPNLSTVHGVNSRLDELQAAILRVKLRHLETDNDLRRTHALTYSARLVDAGFTLPPCAEDVRHVYHQYVVQCSERDGLKEHLREGGVGTGIHYPLPVHLQPGYRDLVIAPEAGLPVTEYLCRRILSLPVHPQLTEAQLDAVCRAGLSWRKVGRS